MKTKKGIFFQILVILLISVSFGYSLVFAGLGGKIEYKITDNIFIENMNLNRARIYINSREDLSDIDIFGDCSVKGKLIENKDNLYAFDIIFSDLTCDKTRAKVYFEKGNIHLQTSFNIISTLTLYTQYIDYSNEKLNEYITGAINSEKELSIYESEYNLGLHSEYLQYLTNSRKLEEVQYVKSIVSDIIEKREVKYLIPVKGVSMATKSSKLPNSGRPYRASYTDGIHEGWDFDTTFGNTVSAIDYGIVIRVVKNFSFSDLGKIKYTGTITEIDKMWNLDTLRGNQVWIKTMKGDMAFYAHLNEVFDNIAVGDIVFKGQPLGTVGISGIPDQNYSDYHLHLEVRKNLYTMQEEPYTFEDYMSWSWYFKGESEKYILENQYDIFEENN